MNVPIQTPSGPPSAPDLLLQMARAAIERLSRPGEASGPLGMLPDPVTAGPLLLAAGRALRQGDPRPPAAPMSWMERVARALAESVDDPDPASALAPLTPEQLAQVLALTPRLAPPHLAAARPHLHHPVVRDTLVTAAAAGRLPAAGVADLATHLIAALPQAVVLRGLSPETLGQMATLLRANALPPQPLVELDRWLATALASSNPLQLESLAPVVSERLRNQPLPAPSAALLAALREHGLLEMLSPAGLVTLAAATPDAAERTALLDRVARWRGPGDAARTAHNLARLPAALLAELLVAHLPATPRSVLGSLPATMSDAHLHLALGALPAHDMAVAALLERVGPERIATLPAALRARLLADGPRPLRELLLRHLPPRTTAPGR